MLGENEEIIESAHNDNDKGLVEQPNSGNDNQSGDHIKQVVQNIRTDQDHFGISRHVRLQDPTAADDGFMSGIETPSLMEGAPWRDGSLRDLSLRAGGAMYMHYSDGSCPPPLMQRSDTMPTPQQPTPAPQDYSLPSKPSSFDSVIIPATSSFRTTSLSGLVSSVSINEQFESPTNAIAESGPAAPKAPPVKAKRQAPARRRSVSTASTSSTFQPQHLQQQQYDDLLGSIQRTTALVCETATKLNENLVFINDRINYMHRKIDYMARKATLQFAITQTSINSFQYYSTTGQVLDSATLMKSILMMFLAGKGYYISNGLTANGINKAGEAVYGNWVFREKIASSIVELVGVAPVFAIGDMDGYQIFFGSDAFNKLPGAE